MGLQFPTEAHSFTLTHSTSYTLTPPPNLTHSQYPSKMTFQEVIKVAYMSIFLIMLIVPLLLLAYNWYSSRAKAPEARRAFWGHDIEEGRQNLNQPKVNV